jgi:hypothetical protein
MEQSISTIYFRSGAVALKKWQTKFPDSDGVETSGVRNVLLPSFPLAEERVVKRSDDRVSKNRQCISANVRRVDSPRLSRTYGTGRPSLRLRRKEGSCSYFYVLNPSAMGNKSTSNNYSKISHD